MSTPHMASFVSMTTCVNSVSLYRDRVSVRVWMPLVYGKHDLDSVEVTRAPA